MTTPADPPATLAPLVLRPAAADDAAMLADLGTRGFIAKFGHMYTPENLARFLESAHTETVVAGELADLAMRIQVAMQGGVAVSFCKLKLRCGWPEHARGRCAIELKQLYTDPDRIGGGAGTALMAWAEDEARAYGADEIQLSVWSGNTQAQRFYARRGFAKVADIEFWVGDHCDEEFLFAGML